MGLPSLNDNSLHKALKYTQEALLLSLENSSTTMYVFTMNINSWHNILAFLPKKNIDVIVKKEGDIIVNDDDI